MKKKADKSSIVKSKVSSKSKIISKSKVKSELNSSKLSKSYLAKSLTMFLQSFKFDLKKLAYILFVDLLFYAVIISSILFSMGLIQNSAKVLDAINPQVLLDTQDTALVESTSATMQGFLTTLKITGLVLLLVFFVAFSISAYLIWMRISNKKKTFKGYLKSLSFAFILLGLFFLLTFLSSQNLVQGVDSSVQSSGAYSFLTLTFLILSAIIYAVYSRSNELLTTLNELFRIFKKIYLLIVPILASVMLIFILATLTFLLMNFALSLGIEAVIMAIFIIALTIYSAWFRNYLYLIVDDILRR